MLGHYVRALVKDPALSNGRIRPGDRIIAVSKNRKLLRCYFLDRKLIIDHRICLRSTGTWFWKAEDLNFYYIFVVTGKRSGFVGDEPCGCYKFSSVMLLTSDTETVPRCVTNSDLTTFSN